jgi:hypothetical protein
MGLDVVAEFLNFHARELLVEALDLLQAECVGADLLQIVEEVGKPLADRVDIPGGDAQARDSFAGGSRLGRRASAEKRRALRTGFHAI